MDMARRAQEEEEDIVVEGLVVPTAPDPAAEGAGHTTSIPYFSHLLQIRVKDM
jgi:hypothetical protein